MAPFVSVIIPVYNDSGRLVKCLAALERETYPLDQYEVIVIDNASSEDIRLEVTPFSHAVYACEGTIGSFFARNKGISLAKGEVIAFTDSDCIPDPKWLENGVKKLIETPNCGLVAGKMQVFFRDQKRPTLVERYEKAAAYKQDRYVKEKHQGMSANIFTFKKVIDKVGDFHTSLWELADYEWGRRVYSYGYKVVYADDAIVLHPARRTLKELYYKAARLTGGFFEVEKSSIHSFKDFIRIFRGYILSTFGDIYGVFLSNDAKGLLRKIEVISLIFFVRLVYILERIRLKLGGKLRR